MVSDQPLIDYKIGDEKNKRSMILSQSESDEMKALVEEWEKDRQGFSYVGKTFSLSDFMAGKV